ncbi:MAG TPA: peptidoglycan DD-metalloendopeptidase family protein [Clostridiaceae bacterium]|nr:peptidoglycan DD-metalloendopeptidase family protein [Clostridiaceae bacterium]
MKLKHRIPIFVLALLFVFLSAGMPLVASSADTAREIEQARAVRDQYNQRLYEATANQQALTNQSNQLSADLSWLATRSEEQRAFCAEVLQQKNDALIVMAQTASDYAHAVEQLDTKKEQYASRLRIMFDYTGKSMLEIFLESETLQSFFTTVEFMKLITESDEQMIEDLIEARAEADQRKADAEEAAVEMERLVAEADAMLAEIQGNELMANSRMYDLRGQLSAADNEAAVWAAETAAVNQEIGALTSQYNAQIEAEYAAEQARLAEQQRQAELARQQAAAAAAQQQQTPAPPAYSGGGGSFAWPVPSSYSITSYYGWRNIFGASQFHGAIDISAPMGAAVVSAKAGVVIMAQWYGGYGNFIVVAHGNGLATCYAHLSGYAVGVGQSVAMGQTIGYIGSTGRSTGPHLHYEVRTGSSDGLSGTMVNPLSFY